MAGTDAQLHDRGHVARFAQGESVFDQPHHIGQIRARVEQRQRAFQCVGMGALLNHARALAIVFADDDQCAAHHARRGEVGQGVGGDVGADDRLPRHRAAQRVVDRRAEHRRCRGLVGAGLDVHAERIDIGSGLHHHVEQVRHRRTLVAADVGHTRLQQRLGDGENAFAMEHAARAQLELLDLFGELHFHRGRIVTRRQRHAGWPGTQLATLRPTRGQSRSFKGLRIAQDRSFTSFPLSP